MPHDILIVLDSVVTCDLDIMLNKGIGIDKFNDGRKKTELDFQLVQYECNFNVLTRMAPYDLLLTFVEAYKEDAGSFKGHARIRADIQIVVFEWKTKYNCIPMQKYFIVSYFSIL